MNALLTLSAVAPSTRSFWLMFADEVGMLPKHACFIQGDWHHLTNEKILGVLHAAYPQLTVTWCDWAERPRDFSISGDVLLVKVLGQNGTPPIEPKDRRSSKEKYRKRRREAEEHWDADVEVRSYRDRLWDMTREHRDPGIAKLVALDATPIDAKCCGISHTLGSFGALELLSVDDRDEGFTRIHEERRLCSRCKAPLTHVSKRLLGSKP